jgi:hypothetical protein
MFMHPVIGRSHPEKISNTFRGIGSQQGVVMFGFRVFGRMETWEWREGISNAGGMKC